MAYNPRSLQASITVNGTQLPNVVKTATIRNNNFFAADTFEVELAVGSLPQEYGANFWSNTQAQIGISIGINSAFTQLILGNSDNIDIDLPRGTLRARGRDLSAAFIDTKTEQKFPNLTSSQIVEQLVTSQAGLIANVTPTTTLAGRYYDIDHVRLTNNISQWTLMNYLAQEEGFDLFVSGNVVYFQPSAQSDTPTFTVMYIPPGPANIRAGNFTDLQLSRAQTLAKDVIVKVVSWNAKQATAFTATAKKSGTGGNPLNATAQVYTYKQPGLTPDQAQQFANARLKEITLHERVVEVAIPGELTLTPRQCITLTGTGTSFDQNYLIDEITRRISVDEGFVQTVRMKNHSPESRVSV